MKRNQKNNRRGSVTPSFLVLVKSRRQKMDIKELRNNRNLFLLILEAGNSKIKLPQLRWPQAHGSTCHSTSPLQHPWQGLSSNTLPRPAPPIFLISMEGSSILLVVQARTLESSSLSLHPTSSLSGNPTWWAPIHVQNWSLICISPVTQGPPSLLTWVVAEALLWHPSLFSTH